MHITKKGLPLLALLLSMVAVEPASAQYYGTPYNPYAPGVAAVNFQPQLDQIRNQISSAVGSGRIGQYDGNNLMQGLDQITAQAYSGDPATISTAISIYSQRVNTLIGQSDANRSTGNYGYAPGNRRRLGGLQNLWR